MQLGSVSIEWTSLFKYLGVVFNAGCKLSVDTDAIKLKFYTVSNCLLGNTYSLTLWTPGAGIPVFRKLQNGAKHRYTGPAQISLHRQKPVYRVCVKL